ncbi:putative HTH-type transcriptional regulator YybR [compost metagenome]
MKRTVYAEVPPRVEYELTELGQSMSPIILAIYNWGENYRNNQKSLAAAALETSGGQP